MLTTLTHTIAHTHTHMCIHPFSSPLPSPHTGHRNVYVGIHVPYSRSKHKHRGRRKSGNGQGKHSRSHRRSSDVSSTLEEVSLDGESLSLGGIEERRRSSFHGQTSEREGLLKRPSYHKSLSAPSSRPRTPPNELATLPTIIGEQWCNLFDLLFLASEC